MVVVVVVMGEGGAKHGHTAKSVVSCTIVRY